MMKKFRRTKTRERFENDPEWQKGYEFEGVCFKEFDLVHEKTQDGALARIHDLESVEEIK